MFGLYSRFLAIMFLLLCALATSSAAQTPAPADNSYENVPDEYLAEADAFHAECATTAKMNHYYDCECLTVKYLDERIKRGKTAADSSIMQAIQEQCADATEAAGYLYNQCLGDPMIPAEIPAEEFCTCYANTYATLYERYGAEPNSQTFVEVQTEAMVTCRNPNLAKRLYPYHPKPKK